MCTLTSTSISSIPPQELKRRSSDVPLWLTTQLLDYSWMGLLALVVSFLFTNVYSLPRAATSCTALGVASVAILQLREVAHFKLLGGRLPQHKRKPLGKHTFPFVFQTAAFSMLSYFTMFAFNIIHYVPPTFSFAFWGSIFVPFYALLVLRDVFFLGPLHSRLHNKPQWYHLHKLHHQPTKSAQSLHAFYIDLLDLIIENVGAPFLLFTAQFLLGLPVGIHWYVGVLLTCHDGALHSVNPFSVMYYNPLLDGVFKGNPTHQLHHALNREYYCFVPWRHVRPSRRRADCERYNRVFGTDFAIC